MIDSPKPDVRECRSMDYLKLLKELVEERAGVEKAIRAFLPLTPKKRGPGRPPLMKAIRKYPRRRQLTT